MARYGGSDGLGGSGTQLLRGLPNPAVSFAPSRGQPVHAVPWQGGGAGLGSRQPRK